MHRVCNLSLFELLHYSSWNIFNAFQSYIPRPNRFDINSRPQRWRQRLTCSESLHKFRARGRRNVDHDRCLVGSDCRLVFFSTSTQFHTHFFNVFHVFNCVHDYSILFMSSLHFSTILPTWSCWRNKTRAPRKRLGQTHSGSTLFPIPWHWSHSDPPGTKTRQVIGFCGTWSGRDHQTNRLRWEIIQQLMELAERSLPNSLEIEKVHSADSAVTLASQSTLALLRPLIGGKGMHPWSTSKPSVAAKRRPLLDVDSWKGA